MATAVETRNLFSLVALSHRKGTIEFPFAPSNFKFHSLQESKQRHVGGISVGCSRHVHSYIVKTGAHPYIPNASDEVQHGSLINSYLSSDQPSLAVSMYAYMRRSGLCVDGFTIPSVLKACGRLSLNRLGEEIHGFAVKCRMTDDVFVLNALILCYSECGDLESARHVFDAIPERDAVSWSTMIRCCGKHKLFGEGLRLIKDMAASDTKPSEGGLVSMISMAADVQDCALGKALHAYGIRHSGTVNMSQRLVSSLIDMYGKCGNADYSAALFGRMSSRCVVSWSSMIAGCIRCGRLEKSEKLFAQMVEDGHFPNEITMLSLITACRVSNALALGKKLHAFHLRNGLPMSLTSASAFIDMYGKCGEVKTARNLFEYTKNKDVMTWTSMISAYAQSGLAREAFELLRSMVNAGVKPNAMTMVSLILLCAETGALEKGKWLHAYLNREGVDSDLVLRTALLDMYAKCGDIDEARRLFDEERSPDTSMWNAMINGYGMHGLGREALRLFSQMKERSVTANHITYVGVLHACAHAGLVEEGKRHFREIGGERGVAPTVEHYGCMVDLLGRAGLLEEAHGIISSMPMAPNVSVWGAFLAACKIHNNPEMAELASGKIRELDPKNFGYSVLMANIYAAARMWNDVAGVRKGMKEAGVRKQPAFSSIEIDGCLHTFVMGDTTHSHAAEIHEKVMEMKRRLEEEGHKPKTYAVLHNIEEEEKESALNFHSEKLALALGLLKTAPGSTLRVMKNLRICDDCHSAAKLLSKLYQRVIIIRDRKRFHRFHMGACSCCDYW